MIYRIIYLLLLISLSAKSQESQLSKEIDFVKSEALVLGFQVVLEDTSTTDLTSPLVIPSDALQNGNIYYWVVFADRCTDCRVLMNYWNSNTLKYHPLDATVNTSDSMQRIEYTFRKSDDIAIKLEAIVESKENTILYSTLFKKEIQK